MASLAKNIIAAIVDKNVGAKLWSVSYEGQFVSLNKWYSGSHWSSRNGLKKKYSKIFNNDIDKLDIQWMDEFAIIIEYNSRHDPDNVVGMAKIFVDCLKGRFFKDDTKKYYKTIAICPDLELDNNNITFNIIKIK